MFTGGSKDEDVWAAYALGGHEAGGKFGKWNGQIFIREISDINHVTAIRRFRALRARGVQSCPPTYTRSLGRNHNACACAPSGRCRQPRQRQESVSASTEAPSGFDMWLRDTVVGPHPQRFAIMQTTSRIANELGQLAREGTLNVRREFGLKRRTVLVLCQRNVCATVCDTDVCCRDCCRSQRHLAARSLTENYQTLSSRQ